LVVPAPVVEALYHQPKFYSDEKTIAAVFRAIHDHGRFVDREWAEANPSVKQIVAYAILRREDRVLCLRRSKRGNRSTLRLRFTLMVGGHVDDLDSASSHPLEDCVVREVAEELGVTASSKPRVLGVVADPSNEVGLLHLGVVFDLIADLDHIVVHRSYDKAEFVNSRRSSTHHLLSLGTLTQKIRSFDPWSKLFLQSEIASSMFGDVLFVERQMKLPLVWDDEASFRVEPRSVRRGR